MLAPLLQIGDTIGIISPCHAATHERYAPMLDGLRAQGFRVKEGANLYKATFGFSASDEERAADLNAMAADPEVKLVFFGGGEGAEELLPYVDFEAICRQPKLYASYSDGTTLLDAITARTGLMTYYGQMPGLFPDISAYNWSQFRAHLMDGRADRLAPNSPWHALTPGVGEGRLIGGYLGNFALMLGTPYLPLPPEERYVLFLEDHETYSDPSRVGALLSHIAQSVLMPQVTGLLFGHFSVEPQPLLTACLRRFGERNGIPVVACDDFGHGENHAVLPIGCHATLDAAARTLRFAYDET